MFYKVFYFLCILFFSNTLFAEATEEIHFKNLSVGTDSERILACSHLGKEKSLGKYSQEIQETLQKTENARVAVACANALGYIQEKGSSTVALKNKIMSESNSDIVYACLISIFNIALKNGYDLEAKSAVQYSDIHHRKDEFVADLIDKIKLKFKE